MKNSFKENKEKELIVRRSFTCCLFHSESSTKKKSSSRPFASKISVILCPEYLFFAGCTHWASSLRTPFLRYSIVDVVILIRRRKRRRKGPEREREREFGRIVRRPSSSSSSLFIIAREEEEEHIFEFAVKNVWVPPSVAST